MIGTGTIEAVFHPYPAVCFFRGALKGRQSMSIDGARVAPSTGRPSEPPLQCSLRSSRIPTPVEGRQGYPRREAGREPRASAPVGIYFRGDQGE